MTNIGTSTSLELPVHRVTVRPRFLGTVTLCTWCFSIIINSFPLHYQQCPDLDKKGYDYSDFSSVTRPILWLILTPVGLQNGFEENEKVASFPLTSASRTSAHLLRISESPNCGAYSEGGQGGERLSLENAAHCASVRVQGCTDTWSDFFFFLFQILYYASWLHNFRLWSDVLITPVGSMNHCQFQVKTRAQIPL